MHKSSRMSVMAAGTQKWEMLVLSPSLDIFIKLLNLFLPLFPYLQNRSNKTVHLTGPQGTTCSAACEAILQCLGDTEHCIVFYQHTGTAKPSPLQGCTHASQRKAWQFEQRFNFSVAPTRQFVSNISVQN